MKKLWFHATDEWKGESFVSSLCLPKVVSDKEPPVPRLCVGPSVASCFAARMFTINPIYVYACFCSAVKPKGVWDCVLTGERWVIHRQVLFHYCTISRDVNLKITYYDRVFHMSGAKCNHKRRAATYARAVEELDEHTTARDKRIIKAFRKFGWI